MKPLYDYIKEAVEVKNDGYYRIVTLVRHDGIDCANLTRDEFIDLMWTDLEKALDEYKGLVHGETIESHKAYVERRVKEAEAYAAKKWKTDKRRQEYIQRAKFNAENDKWNLREQGIFFDFEPDVSNGIPQDCILTPTNVNEQQLGRCFDLVSKSIWWKKATGWTLDYSCGKNSFRNSMRGHVNLIMDESTTAERKRKEKALFDEINSWYGSGRYMGD